MHKIRQDHGDYVESAVIDYKDPFIKTVNEIRNEQYVEANLLQAEATLMSFADDELLL